MTRNTITLLCLLYLCAGARAGEVVLSEDFETAEPNKLPPKWATSSPTDFSVASTPDRGKVLRVTNPKGGGPSVSVVLDIEKLKGHTVKVSVFAKAPAGYTPVTGKSWTGPKLLTAIKGADTKVRYAGKNVDPAKHDWQELTLTAKVEAAATGFTVSLKVDAVAMEEMFFDALKVEIVGDVAAAAAPPPATPGAPAEEAPEKRAAKAPTKNLEEGGILFNAEIAKHLQSRFKKAGPAPKTLVFVGPGMPISDLEGKAPGSWKTLTAPPALMGKGASPVMLMAGLPEYINEHHAEVIFLVAESTTARKIGMSEDLDWSDLANLCIRFGALPVFVIPASAGDPDKDALRTAMLNSANDVHVPVLESKNPSLLPRRVTELTTILEKYVFCRIPLDAAPSGTKPAQEE